jgi:hypothetical protein
MAQMCVLLLSQKVAVGLFGTWLWYLYEQISRVRWTESEKITSLYDI